MSAPDLLISERVREKPQSTHPTPPKLSTGQPGTGREPPAHSAASRQTVRPRFIPGPTALATGRDGKEGEARLTPPSPRPYPRRSPHGSSPSPPLPEGAVGEPRPPESTSGSSSSMNHCLNSQQGSAQPSPALRPQELRSNTYTSNEMLINELFFFFLRKIFTLLFL